MNVRKLIFAGSATALGLGLAGIPAVAVADDPPSKASPTRPTVTHSAGTFTVTLPGVGSLSFGVDPTSGALTALTVTPTPGSGFVAGAPMPIEEGFQVLFTGTSGSQLLEVKVDRDEDVTEVKAEVESPPAAAQAGATPGQDRDGDRDADRDTDQGDDHGNDNGVDNDQDETSVTTIPGAPIGGDHDGMGPHGADGGQAPPHTTPNTNGDRSASSNDGPGRGASSSPGGPGDHGSDGSGIRLGEQSGRPGRPGRLRLLRVGSLTLAEASPNSRRRECRQLPAGGFTSRFSVVCARSPSSPQRAAEVPRVTAPPRRHRVHRRRRSPQHPSD